jgi:hypothetical protein
MIRILMMIAVTCVIFTGAQAFAVELVDQPTMTKHQRFVRTVGCMRKRMSSDRAISYNEAAKVCKDEINKQSGSSASGTLVASDATAKQ